MLCVSNPVLEQVGAKGGLNVQNTFQPSNLSGLVLWLDADYGISLNVSTVSAWADQSPTGANLVQATPAKQPNFVANAINGHAAIQAPSNGAFFLQDAAVTFLNGLSGYTSFVVFKAISTAAANQVAVFTGATQDDLDIASSALQRYVGAGQHGDFAFTDTTTAHISEALYDGTQVGNANRLKSYLDGTQQTLSFTSTIPATTPSGAGYAVGHSAFAFTGLEASVIVFNRALTASEHSKVGKYLGQRYGVTNTY